MSTAFSPHPEGDRAPSVPAELLVDYEAIVTEDDTPVDNMYSEKQQWLLRDPLVSSWQGPGQGRPFLAMVNVGLFYAARRPPLVPDFMLSLDVQAAEDLFPKENRSYFVWVFGKFPDVVAEIVSGLDGGEADEKLRMYARMGVPYYVIFDPFDQLGDGILRVFGLHQGSYQPISPAWLPGVGLGLALWESQYEGVPGVWLRWCDHDGRLLPTGAERANSAEQRAEQLAERLRALGEQP